MSDRDAVRPFFGEHEEVIEGPSWMPDREQRATFHERREAKLRDGLCPMPGCGGFIDEDWYCSQCGCVSMPGSLATMVEDPPLPADLRRQMPQQQMFLDEYAAAMVDEDAAA